MKNIFKFSALSISAALLLIGCGGSSSSDASTSTSNSNLSIDGYFIDSSVKGLKYIRDGEVKFTDKDGTFTCNEGEKIEFLIGNLVLGKSDCTYMVTPYDLTNDIDINNPSIKTLNIARILQSLDDDGSDSIITIPESLKDLDISDVNLEIEADLNTILAKATTITSKSYGLKSTLDANNHMKANVNKYKAQLTKFKAADKKRFIYSDSKVLQFVGLDTLSIENLILETSYSSSGHTGNSKYLFKENEYYHNDNESTPPNSEIYFPFNISLTQGQSTLDSFSSSWLSNYGKDSIYTKAQLTVVTNKGEFVVDLMKTKKLVVTNDDTSVDSKNDTASTSNSVTNSLINEYKRSYPGHTSGRYENMGAFAAIKKDGSVITWGDSSNGGEMRDTISSQLTSDTKTIYSTTHAFAALKNNGSVVTWGNWNGDLDFGADSSEVSEELISGVKTIYSTSSAFSALKTDGSVVTWGNINKPSTWTEENIKSGVVEIFSNSEAFVALKDDGSVRTWGSSLTGGYTDDTKTREELSSGVVHIFSTKDSFAALKNDGSVFTWGGDNLNPNGGDSSLVSLSLTSGVKNIFSTKTAFAALKEDGSVVTWGLNGGDSSTVSEKLTSDVKTIYSTNYAFAALKNDGSVVVWGSNDSSDISSVSSELKSGIKSIYSTANSFTALKDDNTIVTWGLDYLYGTAIKPKDKLSGIIKDIVANSGAYAALKEDGSVVTWGNIDSGGDTSYMPDTKNISTGVVDIFTAGSSFVALKEDGSVVTWGDVSEDTIVLEKDICISNIYNKCEN